MALAMAGLLAVAVVAFRALEQDTDGYREADRPTLHWSATQVEVELSKFISVLSRFTLGDPQISQADVNERFDILWSSTSDFRGGRLGEELTEIDKDIGAIPVLLTRLQSYEAQVLNVDVADREANLELLREFSEVHVLLRKLVVSVLNVEKDRFSTVRNSLYAGKQLTFLVWAAVVVLATLIVGILLVETRRYQRIILETEELVDQARSADRAKSRFLTMMSHELRTPMNGVLGLIQLAKQSGMTDAQSRLLDQAERSGSHMTNLLSDILDFSDLQTERLEIDNGPFETRKLGEAIQDLLNVSARRNAIEVNVEIDPEAPQWIVGDFARLRQSIAHFASYFIEIVGAEDLQIMLSHRRGTLICDLDMDAKDIDRPGWQPEAIFGREQEDYGNFASDSLGPTIARGVVTLMGGTVEMGRPSPRRARLTVTVPSEAVAPDRDCVRLETTSETTSMLVENALRPLRWKIWEPGFDRDRVTAVLVEIAPGENGRDLCERMRKLHEGAKIIALGRLLGSGPFDAVCPIPVDGKYLADLLTSPPDNAAIA